MKKSTLALSIAAAIGGLGMAGNVLAVTGTISGAPSGSKMVVNSGGIGHQLIFPYFTAQSTNATLLTITNTDTTNGKLVKVRFRGAGNSDDLYDFQVALSPGDIWTAAVTKDAATGAAALATSDKSCTLPASVNGVFNLQRVNGNAASQSLEGYVEVINMADIPPITATANPTIFTSALFTAIKHVSGVAPCTAAILTAKLGADNSVANLTATQADGTNAVGLAFPTTGLTGDWIILNQATTAAWSGSATALEVQNITNGVPSGVTTGNMAFWPQISGTPSGVTASTAASTTAVTSLANLTADPLMTSGILAVQNFDLPDLSTLYADNTNAAGQADQTTAQLAVTSVANQYVTEAGIAAVTDLLFSQPMRRYSAAVNYKSTSATAPATGVVTYYPLNTTGAIPAAVFRGAAPSGGTGGTLKSDTSAATASLGAGSNYYSGTATTPNLTISSTTGNLCLSLTAPAKNFIFDREETTPASAATAFVISPATTASTPKLVVCGEAAVVSINNGGTTGASALSASIARSDFTSSSLSTYASGWVVFATPANVPASASGLPILGQSFIRMSNGAVNYGVGYQNKTTH